MKILKKYKKNYRKNYIREITGIIRIAFTKLLSFNYNLQQCFKTVFSQL